MKIQVSMEVDRWRVIGDQVQVWGWVGDYEVMIVLRVDDPRTQKIIDKVQPERDEVP